MESIKSTLVLLYHCFHICWEKTKWCSNKLLPFNIKSINPIRKSLHIIESYVCILKIFVVRFLLPVDFLVSLGIYSTPKLSKQVTTLDVPPSLFTYKAIHWVLFYSYSLRLITYSPSFILGKLSNTIKYSFILIISLYFEIS